MSTSVGGRNKEVKDFKRHDTVQRKLRQVERLKEVARVSDALEIVPVMRSINDTRHFKEVVLLVVYC